MDWEKRITTDPEIMVGKPTISGTRITVEFILGRFADGWTEKEILYNYPRLTPDDLRAAFAYAAECINDDWVFSLPSSNK